MQKIIAIEPGATKSAYALMMEYEPIASGLMKNEELVEYIKQINGKFACVIELLPIAGVPFSEHVFLTNTWVGHFQAATSERNMPVSFVSKTEAARHLVGRPDATDRSIRRALCKHYSTKRIESLYQQSVIAFALGATYLEREKAKLNKYFERRKND